VAGNRLVPTLGRRYAGIPLMSLIPILFFAGIGVACLLWLPRGRARVGTEPRCAACDYIVHGLPGPICPECGSDLSKPGAILTGGPLPPGRVVRSVGWTLFCALAIFIPLTFIWTGLVVPRLPQVRSTDDLVTLSQPASKGYQSIAVHAAMHAHMYVHDPDPLPNDLQIKLTCADGALHQLVIDPATLHFRDALSPPGAMSTRPLDVDALVAWVQQLRVPGAPEQLKREMALTLLQVRQEVTRPQSHQLASSGEFAGMGNSSSASIGPFTSADWIPGLVGGLIWCIGIIRILMTPRKPS